jgi:hypothetical protein
MVKKSLGEQKVPHVWDSISTEPGLDFHLHKRLDQCAGVVSLSLPPTALEQSHVRSPSTECGCHKYTTTVHLACMMT